jgi:cell division protein DivIC
MGNSYANRKRQLAQEKELQEQLQFYEKEISRLTEELQEIHQDPEELEKFAREQYFYKEKGEEIFVLENK